MFCLHVHVVCGKLSGKTTIVAQTTNTCLWRPTSQTTSRPQWLQLHVLFILQTVLWILKYFYFILLYMYFSLSTQRHMFVNIWKIFFQIFPWKLSCTHLSPKFVTPRIWDMVDHPDKFPISFNARLVSHQATCILPLRLAK